MDQSDQAACSRQEQSIETIPTAKRGAFSPSWVFLYGPSGSGKSTVGKRLSESLGLPFYDLDARIAEQAGRSISDIFDLHGEAGFRKMEAGELEKALLQEPGVMALGGGALLSAANREIVEACGAVVCLSASLDALSERLQSQPGIRPLLAGDSRHRLEEILAIRKSHYASFVHQIATDHLSADQVSWEIQKSLGMFHVSGMGSGYDVRVLSGGIDWFGEALRWQLLGGPIAVVSDQNVGELYAARLVASIRRNGYEAQSIILPAGEKFKTIATVICLWEELLETGLERGSTVVALGGGVVGDMAGFAASAYLRGVRWVAVPTSLLAMVDASLGGKTGVDLPRGKNLVGAFHPPSLVWVDPQALSTLPTAEIHNGLAEVVKHGIIGDPGLFDLCGQGWGVLLENWGEIVRRGMAVKVRVIQDDPFERGRRASLNLGHTLGHAIETASDFLVKHGQAVSIGMVYAARMSEALGIAEAGLAERITVVLENLGLPTRVPADLDRERFFKAVSVDKKRLGGKPRFVLPVRLGEVRWGLEVEGWESFIDV